MRLNVTPRTSYYEKSILHLVASNATSKCVGPNIQKTCKMSVF